MWTMLQVAQWKAEVERLEETAVRVVREVHEAQAAVSKSRTRQEALELQASMRALEGDRTRAGEARGHLEDCKGALERLAADAQRSTAALEAARGQVKELQESLRSKEAALAGVRSAAAGAGSVSVGCAPTCLLECCLGVLMCLRGRSSSVM